MENLTKLKSCSDQKDLAELLGYPEEKNFTHALFSTSFSERYKIFFIPKKNGNTRKILSPNKNLRTLQRRLSELLTECHIELEQKRLLGGSKAKCISSHGYRKSFIYTQKNGTKQEIKLGIKTNAQKHQSKKFVLNLDIENFFETITFSRIVGFFTKNEHFKLDYDVAVLIAQIATYRDSKSAPPGYLPQGSPCSPIISNLIGDILDFRLLKIAERYKCTYSRYVDDLTFSTNMKAFPVELAFESEGAIEIGIKLESAIKKAGFSINKSKTRLTCYQNRQEVTGLVVNKKANINQQYYRYTRSMVHEYCTTGKYTKSNFHSKPNINNEQALSGILGYIHSIKTENTPSSTYKKFEQLSSVEKLHVQYLFHRNFIYPKRILVIGEGITDRLHLKYASYKIMTKEKSNKLVKFSSLENTKKFSSITGLTGGTPLLIKFLEDFQKIEKANSIHQIPTVILVDGDNDGAKVIKAAAGIFKKTIRKISLLGSSLEVNHIHKNLYIIQLPKNLTIEDMYPQSILQSKIGNRTFNSSNESFDYKLYYGKVEFFEKIVQKSTIDFEKTDFKGLINTFFSIAIYNLIFSILENQKT